MAKKAAMAIEDVLRLRQVGEPQLSPDGRCVAYVVTQLDEDSKEYRRDLWLASTDGDEARQLTYEGDVNGEPRWSADGTQIAFVSNRGEEQASQIWLLPIDGGEARQLTTMETGCHGIDWAPDGQSLLFLSREAPGEKEKKLQERGGIRIVDRFVKMHQVWTATVTDGRCRQLTRDRSSKSAARWSPDGRRIAFEKRRDPTSNHDYQTSLWVMAASGKAKRQLSDGDSCATAPAWCPDGSQIAFLRRTAPRYPHLNELAVVPSTGGEVRVLTQRLDRGVSEPRWSADGRRICAIVQDGVRQHVHAVTVRGGRVRQLTTGDREISGLSLAARGGKMAFVSSSPTRPGEVHVTEADGGDERPLTALNPQVRGMRLGRTRIVHWQAADGLRIEGLLVLPPGYRKGKRVPLLVDPHGGPAGSRGCGFAGNWQMFGGLGYAVLAPNFRGSTGYGQAFLTANDDDFGGGDFADLMAGVDAMIDTGFADARRMGIMGYSYGGFMTAWAIGQTDRFQAAAAGAGVMNLQSFYGTTDIQWFTGGFQHGAPWQNPESYRAQSPITYVHRVKTPTLIYHGDEDRRVPMEQSEQLYVSLRERGVPTELVRYPRAGHGLSEYWHRRDSLERIAAWFDRYVKGGRRAR